MTPPPPHLLHNNFLMALCQDPMQLTLAFPVLQCMLEKVGNWNFDIFLFDKLTNGEKSNASPTVPPIGHQLTGSGFHHQNI